MIYEIRLTPELNVSDDIELFHDNPISAHEVFNDLRKQYGDDDVIILRDDIEITVAQLASDIQSNEIHSAFEEDCRLPSTFRRGRGSDSDLGIGADGGPAAVWKPKNPEDVFS